MSKYFAAALHAFLVVVVAMFASNDIWEGYTASNAGDVR